MSKPKILVYDIETAPILGYVWSIWEQNLGLNQVKVDWHILAVAAKWYGSPASEMTYVDQRDADDIEDDKRLLSVIWKLFDEADIVVTQNGKNFDEKKLNARFIMNGMKPPSPYKHVDTKQIASSKFGFTSNKLEYMASKLCKKFRKSEHKKFPGFSLWTECLNGNRAAWDEMEKYNRLDVLATEELYTKFQPWDNSINPNLFSKKETYLCLCGSEKYEKRGYSYTITGKFQRYVCLSCGAWSRGRINLFPKDKRSSLRRRA